MRNKQISKNGLGLLPQIPRAAKIEVLDVSGAVYEPDCLTEHKGVHFIIPTTTISILSRISQNPKDSGKKYAAEKFLQNFNDIVEGKRVSEKISFGKNSLQVFYPNGGLESKERSECAFPDNDEKNTVLDTCILLKKMGHTKVVLYSTDIHLKIKASFLDIDVYKGHEVVVKDFNPPKTLVFKKTVKTEKDEEEIKKMTTLPQKLFVDTQPFNEGEYYILPRKDQKYFILRFQKGSFKKVYPKECAGIREKNIEQAIALAVLTDPSITAVAITGASGSGKTLLSLAAGIQGYHEKAFTEIAMSKAIIEVGNSLGFLPGDLQEKIDPHVQNFYDNISFIKTELTKAGNKNAILASLDKAEKVIGTAKKALFIEAVQTLRGRTFTNRFFIIDECQNLTPHEIKTIITRAGEGTKVVLLGDVNQIDSPYLDKNTNGLTHLVERFRGLDLFAHVHLSTTERSPLAALADKFL